MAQTAARLERQCLCPGRRTGRAGGYVGLCRPDTGREPPPPRASVRLPARRTQHHGLPLAGQLCAVPLRTGPGGPVCPPAAGIRHRRARLLQLSRHGGRQLVPCRRAAGRRPSAAGRRPARHPAPVRARAAAPALPAPRPHAAGHVLRCGQKHPGRRLLPHPASGWLRRGSVQGPEHVPQLRGNRPWRRDGARPDRPGPGGPHRSRGPHESRAAQTAFGDRVTGHRPGQTRGAHAGPRIFPLQGRALADRARRLRHAGRPARGHGPGRGRQPRRGEPQAARHRQHAHGRPRAGLGAAGGRHRPRRGLCLAAGHLDDPGTAGALPAGGLARQQVPGRRFLSGTGPCLCAAGHRHPGAGRHPLAAQYQHPG